MKNNKPQVDLLTFFFISLTALTLSGFLFKSIFVVYNTSQFSSLPSAEIIYALFWGLRFDLASAALLTLISCFILWFFNRFLPKKQPAFFLLGLMLFVQMSLQIGDTVYFVEAGRHVSYEMRDVFIDASGLFLTAVTKHGFFIVSSYILALAVIFILIKLAKKTRSLFSGKSLVAEFKLKPEAGLLVVLLLSVLFVRGGISGLPQSVNSAFNIGDAQLAIITMNGSYSVVYGALNSSKEISRVEVKLPADININQVMKSLYPGTDSNPGSNSSGLDTTASYGKKFQPYNLVFVLLEGWPADGMSGYGYGENTTPFFDSLMQKSLTPLGAISGGGGPSPAVSEQQKVSTLYSARSKTLWGKLLRKPVCRIISTDVYRIS